MHMMNIRRVLAAIGAALTAALLLASLPATAAPKPDDCNRVAKADRTLCQRVKAQLPYAYVTPSGIAYTVGGKTLVREITHQGLTTREMHSYLHGEATAYREYATGSRSVVVNLASLRRHHGTDAQYTVGFTDRDGKPGGAKDDRVDLDLP